jgi:DNA-binding XRE family transcriptional regulator
MRQIRPMHGMSISTLALTIGLLRRMSIVFGVLEVDIDF